jgi:hypothetical protein
MRLLAGTAVVLVGSSLTGCNGPGREVDQSQVRQTVIVAQMVAKAAELERALDETDPSACPTVDSLVKSRRLEATRRADPWGTPFKIICTEDKISVVSLGKDHQEGTPDDLSDSSTRSDIERVVKLIGLY